MNILIVEDYRPSLEKLNALLSKMGHEITTVENGKDALEIYKKNIYDVIFIDWSLPDINSIRLCSDIKDLDTLRQKNSFVIFTTGKSQKRDMVEALDAGANDFILKPYDDMILKSRLDIAKRYLGAKKSPAALTISQPVEVMTKEHELIRRMTRTMDMLNNLLDEPYPIPEKVLVWCTSSVFLLNFKLHEGKENYYIEAFIERAKNTHGQTSTLFTRSSLAQIMKEHEIIEKLIMDMQKTMRDYQKNEYMDIKKLKEQIVRYVTLMRSHAAREDEIFFPFTQNYLKTQDIKKIMDGFQKVEDEIGLDKIDARIKTLDELETVLKIK